MRTSSLNALCVLALAGVIRSQGGEAAWVTDFDQAKAAAAKEHKLILADFTGSDWCVWCVRLKDEVFDTPEFEKWAKKNVVLLELDFPRSKKLPAELKEQNQRLAKEFGIRGYPTVLFLDAEGKKVGRLGYAEGGPGNWIKLAEAQMHPDDGVEAKEPAKDGAKAKTGEQGKKSDGDGWMTDYAAALARAKKERKVVLADFTGSDWCVWCQRLKAEVFDTPEFKRWADKKVVLLELDFPRSKQLADELKEQNQKLAKEFKISGYPTILFLDPQGKKIGQMGYEAGGPEKWLKKAEKQARRD